MTTDDDIANDVLRLLRKLAEWRFSSVEGRFDGGLRGMGYDCPELHYPDRPSKKRAV